MSADNLAPTRYWYIPRQGFEARIRHRLQTDLGLEDAAADAILCLRTQVLELQAQLHVLEVELAAQTAGQNLRLTHYHEDYFEANWIELEFRE